MIRGWVSGLAFVAASAAAAAEAPPLSCADAGAMVRVFMVNERITTRLATDCIARPDAAACQVMRDSLSHAPQQLRPTDLDRSGAFLLWLLKSCAADPAFP